jgi:hypothetical protein
MNEKQNETTCVDNISKAAREASGVQDNKNQKQENKGNKRIKSKKSAEGLRTCMCVCQTEDVSERVRGSAQLHMEKRSKRAGNNIQRAVAQRRRGEKKRMQPNEEGNP